MKYYVKRALWVVLKLTERTLLGLAVVQFVRVKGDSDECDVLECFCCFGPVEVTKG